METHAREAEGLLFIKNILKSVGWRLFPQHLAQHHLGDEKWAEIEEIVVPIFVNQSTEAVDVGANRGRYSILLSLGAKHVHAFDPNPECISNLRSLHLPNASIYPYALSSMEGVSKYFVPFREGEQFSPWGTLEHSALDTHQKVDTLEVAKSTLDALCDRPIRFVKVDVEGHEMDVLEGGRQLIANQQPIFMVEAEDRHREDAVQQLTDFFAEFSYKGFFILDKAVFPMASFKAEFQNPAELNRSVPRIQMRYVNNFIFIPASLDPESMVQKMRQRLNRAIAHEGL
jgi:FkbM family methyltransferase